MEELNYTPVPVSVCKYMLRDLFSLQAEFKQFVTPNGLRKTPIAGFFQFHLLSKYSRYRMERIKALLTGAPIDHKKLIQLDDFIIMNLDDNLDEEIELTLIFAHTVYKLFTLPHVIHDNENRTYRLHEPNFPFQENIFLLNTLKEFGILPDTITSLDHYYYNDGDGRRIRKAGRVKDFDFSKAYQFVFQYLHGQGLTWNFGTYINLKEDPYLDILIEFLKLENYEQESYDPYKAVLAQLENGELNNEDNSDEDHNEEEVDEAKAEYMNDTLGWMKDAIIAYQVVYGHEPPGLPKKS